MLAQGVKIHFAHRTFSWSNEARGKAAVHCVIIGFGLQDEAEKTIYEYDDIKGVPHAVKARNINPYLVDVADVLLNNSTLPICNVPEVTYGSFALDDGNYTLSLEDKQELIDLEHNVEKYIRPFIGGQELIRNQARYCLWLRDAEPQAISAMPAVLKRIEAVKKWRMNSDRKTTQKLAAFPALFAEIRQPDSNYLALPTVSSERRAFIPIAFLSANVIASNQIYIIPNATLFNFGVLTSTMHNAWIRSVCGRLKSDFRYSAGIVYNNYPWPEPNDKQRENIETAAQAVLDARAAHPQASLADLYDPLTMPTNLLKAHQVLDKAVDAAYGYKGVNTDAARVAFLFERYQAITSLLPAVGKARKTRKQ
jgi:hypothetical protein